MKRFETYVAWRYLLTRKKTGFISLISLISIIGIAVGVGALIIVLSMMNGFTKELRTRLVGMDGHIWVTTPRQRGIASYKGVQAKLSRIPGVTGVSAFCTYETVASTAKSRHMTGVYVRGVDTTTVESVSAVDEFLVDGSFDVSEDDDGVPGIILGRYLAYDLNYVSVGDIIYVYGKVDMDRIFEDFIPPPVYKFRVTGLFESGYYDYDSMIAIVDMSETQKILNMEGLASGIVMKIDDMFDAGTYTKPGGIIEQELGGPPYAAQDWIEKNQVLFKWMELEKMAAFIVLSLIILVAAFNIISSLIMMVMDKTREIGILKSMGATRSSIRRIFVYQGAFVGVVGTLAGSILGSTVCLLQDKYQFLQLPGDIYFVSALPVEFQLHDVLLITVVTMLLCWISSFYPAKKAAELAPVDAIRSD